MAAAKKQATKETCRVVFTIEYSVEIEDRMSINLENIMDSCRENGFGDVVNVEVRNYGIKED